MTVLFILLMFPAGIAYGFIGRAIKDSGLIWLGGFMAGMAACSAVDLLVGS